MKLLSSFGIVENFFLLREIDYKGTCYRLDQYVVLGRDGFDINMGKIGVIVLHQEKAFLVAFPFIAVSHSSRGYFCLSTTSRSAIPQKIEFDELLDYYPLSSYVFDCVEYLVLKHNV